MIIRGIGSVLFILELTIFLVKFAMLQAWSYLVSGSLSVKLQLVEMMGGFFTPVDGACCTA